MRLTALCVCGTLLAFTSLFWTTADSDEGDLLWDNEFGPCTANLRPEGPCRHRQDGSTCPYLFSLPPLTVHLPKQLRELEKIVEDLQKLKDNVDQLRKMCADCKVSQTERECGRQREHEKLNEGAERRKDERNWLNERNPGRLKDFSLQCGTDRVKAENTTKGDGDTHSEKTILEEKERKKWEAERERSDKVVVKGNEDEETLEMTEKDGKTQTEGAKGKDKFGQTNDGNERIVDMVRKNVEKNNRERETDRNKEKKSTGNSKGDQGDVREKEKERKTTSNIKNKEKTEESTYHVWRDETKKTEKKTQTEEDRHSDGIKMSEDHDGHTNQERRQYGEERKKEMEKGIKMERNNEKPKQTESIGHAEKEKTIKEGEVGRDWESAMEIKTEGEKAVQTVQRDGDGELASSKATERTDFVSISPTPHSTISLAPRHDSMDSNKAVTFASPPSSSILTSHLNTGVNQGRTITPDRLPTQSTGRDAGGISEHPGPDVKAGFRTTSRPTTATINTLGGPGQQITSANTRFPSTTSARPEMGFQGRISPTMATTTTTTPHQNLYTTTFPGVSDRNRWTAKKNISSNTKTGVKPLPGRGLKPGEKHKPEIKPEADRRPKNPKTEHKPDRVPLPDSKTKHDQKQKPAHQKPATNQKPKPGKDPKPIQNPKPDQRPENLPTNQNLKNTQTPKRDQEHTTNQNKLAIQKPKSNQKFTPPVQRPTSTSQTVNATESHRDPQTDREITIIDQESKPEKKPVNPLETDDPDQNLKNEEKTKHDQRSTVNQYSTPAQEFEPETTSLTPKPNQKLETELIEDSDQNLSSKPKSFQEPPGPGHAPDENQLPTQKPKSHEKSLLPVQRPTSTSKTAKTSSSDKDPRTDRVSVERTIINQNSKPVKKPVNPLKTENSDQKRKPPKTLTSEEKLKPDQRSSSNTPVQEPEPETSSLTPKPNQKPKTELLEDSDLNLSPKPKPVQNLSPGQEHTPDQNQLPTQKPKSSQKSTLPVQKPTGSKKDSLTDSEPEITSINQKLKPEEKTVNPLKTNNHDQNPKPPEKLDSEEKLKPDQRSSSNTPVQELEPQTSSLTPKPNQKPGSELLEDSDLNLSPKPKPVQDLSPGQNQLPTQKPKSSQKSTLPVQKPTGSNKDSITDSEPEITIINQELKPEEKPVNPLKTDNNDKNPKPPKKTENEEKSKPDQRSSSNTPDQELEPETSSLTPKPNQKPGPELLEDSDLNLSPKPKPVQEPPGQKLTTDRVLIKPETSSLTPKPNQKPGPELLEDSDLNLSPKPKPVQEPPGQKLTTDRVLIKPPNQKPKPNQKIPKINQKLKPGQTPKLKQKPPIGQKTKPNVRPKPEQTPQTNGGFKTPRPDQMPNPDRKSVSDESPESKSSKTFKPKVPPKLRPPTRPTIKSGVTPAQRPKPAKPKIKTELDPLQIGSTTSDGIQNSQTDMPPASGPVKQIAEVTHSPGDTELKTITLSPKTSNRLETGPFPSLTMSPNSRITSDLRPQTAGQVPSIPMTTRPNKIMRGIFPGVIPSASPGSTKPKQASKTDSRLQAHTVEETAPSQTPEPDIMAIPVPSPRPQTTSTTRPDLRSTTPATSGPEPLAAEASTPSARELRVKINQVAAFFNNSLSPNERPLDRHPKEHPEDNQGGSRPDRRDSTLPSKVPLARRDCSDYRRLREETKSGVYLVTPDPRHGSFRVFCDMELDGGGWTVLQRRQDGSVSFNRTWAEYRSGFGELDGGEFWLGNNFIHLLTRDRDMVLRVELEDFEGVMEHAEYEQFRVASERLRYRMTVGRYSGTAGDALRFSKSYDHNNRAFTTPDRDHDRYPSGNCGAYYSSGWWFDSCMAANLNGRYYVGKYKGVRDGIFWGTWHNISTEYYLTNDRQSFKTVRMMIRPKGFTP